MSRAGRLRMQQTDVMAAHRHIERERIREQFGAQERAKVAQALQSADQIITKQASMIESLKKTLFCVLKKAGGTVTLTPEEFVFTNLDMVECRKSEEDGEATVFTATSRKLTLEPQETETTERTIAGAQTPSGAR